MEAQILAACIADRKAFDAVHEHIDKDTFSPLGAFWWRYVVDWYARDVRATRIDPRVLEEQASAELARTKQAETLRSLLPSDVDSGAISPANIVASVLDLRKRSLILELSAAMGSSNRAKCDQLFRRLADLWDRDPAGESGSDADSLADIHAGMDGEHRIRLLPKSLNERTAGGALAGQHIVVFGRTEVGKSTFVLNLCAGFLRQGKKVLYIGNEDQINALKFRFACRVAKKTYREGMADLAALERTYDEKGGNELMRFRREEPGTIDGVRRLVDETEPQILVLDQIRNLEGPEKELTQRLEANATRVRSLLAHCKLVGVSVTQANDRSERHSQQPPIWLSTSDCADSRVGLPAQADLMLGIGADNNMMRQGTRAISLCKNKLDSGPKSREGIIVTMDLQRGIVK